MSEASLQQKASALRALEQVQKQLAVAGHHRDALKLGKKIRMYKKVIAKEYLEIKDIPDSPNDFLVKELSVVCAEANITDKALRSKLRLAVWHNGETVTPKLETAYEALPDLNRVLEILS